MKLKTINEISYDTDNLAEEGCRLLTKSQKETFFNTTNTKRYYVKGIKKGKERDIYEVDGRCFNKIWKLIYPYVFTSCSKSVYYDPYELEEAVSEVKITLFSVLQRFGPVFNGKSLSQRLGIIVNIALTNNHRKKYQNQIQTVSIDEYLENDDSNEAAKVDMEDKNMNMKYVDFWCDVPDNIKEPADSLISGVPISNIQKIYGNKVKKELINFTNSYT
jgi:hypothetical protein